MTTNSVALTHGDEFVSAARFLASLGMTDTPLATLSKVFWESSLLHILRLMKLILLYGAPAVGKLTVGRELSRVTGISAGERDYASRRTNAM
jgi:hypothetical protein